VVLLGCGTYGGGVVVTSPVGAVPPTPPGLGRLLVSVAVVTLASGVAAGVSDKNAYEPTPTNIMSTARVHIIVEVFIAILYWKHSTI
jgi:hypothetical protein